MRQPYFLSDETKIEDVQIKFEERARGHRWHFAYVDDRTVFRLSFTSKDLAPTKEHDERLAKIAKGQKTFAFKMNKKNEERDEVKNGKK